MSVHLVGGGRELELAPVVYGGFVSEARAHASAVGRQTPRIGVVVLAPKDDQAAAVDWFAVAMTRCGAVDVLAATATEDAADGLRRAAGAALAGARALLGGWRLGGIAVTHEDNAEDLDELSVVDGLGLVPGSVEVHAAQWGTLSRLVAAIDAGATATGMAIDENTVVIVAPTSDSAPAAEVQVSGVGQAWLLTFAGGTVAVGRRPAG